MSVAGPPPMLTQAQVDELRALHATKRYTLKMLGAKYNVSERTVYMYIHNRNKKGVPVAPA